MMEENMGRLHLTCYQKKIWEIQEEGVDYIGAMHEGKVSQLYTDDVLQADTLPELLRLLQENDPEYKWYVVMDFIDSRHNTRRTEYPHHREIHLLRGFIPDVCYPRKSEPYLAEWEVRYVRELWIAASDEKMLKVRNFEPKADREALLFIEQNKLSYEKMLDSENNS